MCQIYTDLQISYWITNLAKQLQIETRKLKYWRFNKSLSIASFQEMLPLFSCYYSQSWWFMGKSLMLRFPRPLPLYKCREHHGAVLVSHFLFLLAEYTRLAYHPGDVSHTAAGSHSDGKLHGAVLDIVTGECEQRKFTTDVPHICNLNSLKLLYNAVIYF